MRNKHLRKSTVTDFPSKKHISTDMSDTDLEIIKHNRNSSGSIYMSHKDPQNFDKNSIFVS